MNRTALPRRALSPNAPDALPRTVALVGDAGGTGQAEAILAALAREACPELEVLFVSRNLLFESDIAMRYPEIETVALPELADATSALNAGILRVLRRPSVDAIWILDGTATPRPGAFYALAETMAARPDTGAVGSLLLEPDAQTIRAFGSIWDVRTGEPVACDADEPARHADGLWQTVDSVGTGSMLVRPSLFRDTGLFRPLSLPFAGCDWCLRVHDRGYAVLADGASRAVAAPVAPLTFHDRYAARLDAWRLQLAHGLFGRRHFARTLAGAFVRAAHDRLSARESQARAILCAGRDFMLDRRGAPPLSPSSPFFRRAALVELFCAERPADILLTVPHDGTLDGTDLRDLAAHGVRFTAVAVEDEEKGPLPDGMAHWALPARRLARRVVLAWRILFGSKARYLVTDAARSGGFLALCARMVAMADGDGYRLESGGWRRILRTFGMAGHAARWAAAFLHFAWHFERLRNPVDTE